MGYVLVFVDATDEKNVTTVNVVVDVKNEGTYELMRNDE